MTYHLMSMKCPSAKQTERDVHQAQTFHACALAFAKRFGVCRHVTINKNY